MSFASKKNPAGTAPGKVRNLTKEKFTRRAFKVRWRIPPRFSRACASCIG
jgi:hypothetical protein